MMQADHPIAAAMNTPWRINGYQNDKGLYSIAEAVVQCRAPVVDITDPCREMLAQTNDTPINEYFLSLEDVILPWPAAWFEIGPAYSGTRFAFFVREASPMDGARFSRAISMCFFMQIPQGIYRLADLTLETTEQGRLHEDSIQTWKMNRIAKSADHCMKCALVVPLAISLLNAENVTLVDAGTLHENMTKKQRRALRVPWIKYQQLRVRVGDRLVPIRPKEADGHGGKALHKVRGHFRRYGSGGRGKLFGRISGRFWVPAHVRGAADNGVIVTDYELDSTGAAT